MQTILGAGGDIGKFLATALRTYTSEIRLVGRNPEKVNDGDELLSGDLLNAAFVQDAVKGSEVAYLTVGLAYDVTVWERQWPVIMKNTIEACVQQHCRLVFFDNVYSYSKTAIPMMTEESPIDPPSRKGRVRARLLHMLEAAAAADGLQYLVARSADFYGPGARNGILNLLVLNNFKKGRRANWQTNAYKIHSLTYTPDAANATALLGNTTAAYGQVWHLPTSEERLTGKQLIELAAGQMKVKPQYSVLSPLLLTLGGLFSRTIKELREMQYQNSQDYYFDSSKFKKAFGVEPTGYAEGIRQTIAAG
ncbi:NAD-dependent epimerase/dehydratase family protein [Niabella beijingensis]|uniref:NAD-dependent epimerase/dehydratase family protein n=1 Tax=Niabella beijingensis TaxID=2872700 RepID=UPI001CC18EC7|nr:NAD-dependent epimerase/dehydratase family protein [Niabella beijingensis]MBZ4191760.1 NAD-dependent epimerase/dehydratase family protein [Niabella beijingensis]